MRPRLAPAPIGLALSLAAGLLVGLVPARATAQAPSPEDAPAEARLDEAREAFREGLRFADRGDWERAVERFRFALDIVETAPVRYNLAESLARMGRLVEAQDELRRLRSMDDIDDDVARSADWLHQYITPRIGRLRIGVTGALPSDALITVDGRPIPQDLLGEETPTDPGVRVVRLLRDTNELDVSEVDVPIGGLAEVRLELPDVPEPLFETPIVPVAPDPAPAPAAGPDYAWVAWLVGGLLVAGAAATVAVVVATDGQGGMGDFSPPVLVFE